MMVTAVLAALLASLQIPLALLFAPRAPSIISFLSLDLPSVLLVHLASHLIKVLPFVVVNLGLHCIYH